MPALAAPPESGSMYAIFSVGVVLWIVYGIIVMILGFMRRSRPMRIGSIILLGVSILKVFLYDLRFLEQPYRIVSFIALGVILLLASYLYQRYKHIILEGASPEP